MIAYLNIIRARQLVELLLDLFCRELISAKKVEIIGCNGESSVNFLTEFEIERECEQTVIFVLNIKHGQTFRGASAGEIFVEINKTGLYRLCFRVENGLDKSTLHIAVGRYRRNGGLVDLLLCAVDTLFFINTDIVIIEIFVGKSHDL